MILLYNIFFIILGTAGLTLGILWILLIINDYNKKNLKQKNMKELPDKWCFKVNISNYEEFKYLRKLSSPPYGYITSMPYGPLGWGCWSTFSYGTEITFEDFKRLVLKAEVKKEIDMNAILEEAKKKYPNGCVAICLTQNIPELINEDLSIKGDKIVGGKFSTRLYKDGKWAERVSLPNEDKNEVQSKQTNSKSGYFSQNPIVQKLEDITRDWIPHVTKFKSPLSGAEYTFTGIGTIYNDSDIFDASGSGLLHHNGKYAEKVEDVKSIADQMLYKYFVGIDTIINPYSDKKSEFIQQEIVVPAKKSTNKRKQLIIIK